MRRGVRDTTLAVVLASLAILASLGALLFLNDLRAVAADEHYGPLGGTLGGLQAREDGPRDGRLALEGGYVAQQERGGGSGGGHSCVFEEWTYIPGGWRYRCYTWVLGPYLYSIEGLETSFGIRWRTVVYIEGYGYGMPSTGYCPELPPRWNSLGKMEVASTVSWETSGLRGDQRDRIRFGVTYVLERYYIAVGPNVGGRCVWRIYPVEIWGVERLFSPEQYRADRVPYHATGPVRGDRSVYFAPWRDFFASFRQPDHVVASTPVTFSMTTSAGPVSWTLPVGFYRAGVPGRPPPYVRIRDVSGRTSPWYWWWFRDNDPTYYELILYSYSS